MPHRFGEGLTLSIGGERIGSTMQAEIERMTPEEAVASGLFDLPDEPGMVRLPVTIELPLTPELQAAIDRAEAKARSEEAAETPAASRVALMPRIAAE